MAQVRHAQRSSSGGLEMVNYEAFLESFTVVDSESDADKAGATAALTSSESIRRHRSEGSPRKHR